MNILNKRKLQREKELQLQHEREILQQKQNNQLQKIKKVFSWILAGLLLVLALPFLPSMGSVLLLLAAFLLAPIPKLQNFLDNICETIFKEEVQNKSKWRKKKNTNTNNPKQMKGLIIGLIALFGIISAGASTETPDVTDDTSTSIEQQVGSEESDADLTDKTDSTVDGNIIPEDSTFSIHFIDVGQADAALVECDGHYMLIDGGNKEDSNVIYSVLKNAEVEKLDIVVGTHAHEDHIGGLPGAFNYTTADVTLCPVTSYDSDAFDDFAKYADEKGGGITVPSANDSYELGSSTVTILGLNSGSDTNDTSIVLRIDYGETSFLFTGDAEYEAEKTILDSGANLSATVLKVGHHGSDTSTNYTFLREIMPSYAVISVGEGNTYGHPTEETLSRLRDAEVTVFRTDLQGDIFCVSDGKTVTFDVERNADADTLATVTPVPIPTPDPEPAPIPEPEPEPEPEVSTGTDYVLNTNTKKFHYPSCSSVKKMNNANKSYYNGAREDVINMGYDPCGNCHP